MPKTVDGVVTRPWVSAMVAVAVLALIVLRPNLSADLKHLLLLVLGGLFLHILQTGIFWGESLKIVKRGVREVMRGDNALIESAAKCGLTAVYPDRELAHMDVIDAINRARERVWLLGISFSKTVSLTDLIPNLNMKASVRTMEGLDAASKLFSEFREGRLTSRALLRNLRALLLHGKINRSFDLKVLLLDPLTSPAVFRSALECSLEEFQRIINFSPRGGPLDPLFQQKLYDSVVGAFKLISRKGNEAFRDRVKFYAHNPNCWLVIADDTAFFEPYTLGSAQESGVDSSMGPYFPVFRFELGKDEKPFEIMENHFTRLWLTSDVDWFHFKSRLAGQDQIVTELFSRRTDWLRRANGALSKWRDTGSDLRKWPRRPCDSEPRVSARVNWKDGDVLRQCDATIHDYSRAGLCLALSDGLDVARELSVTLTKQEQHPPVTKQAQQLLDYFTDKEFKIKWKQEDGSGIRIGLQGTL